GLRERTLKFRSIPLPALINRLLSGGANIDGFVLRLDTNKTGNASVLAATYIGGSNGDDTISSVATDREPSAANQGSLYDVACIAGKATSSDFPKNAEFNSGGTELGLWHKSVRMEKSWFIR